ncbi:hypothetical protein GW17_00012575, partial [Ensete ventricosum]
CLDLASEAEESLGCDNERKLKLDRMGRTLGSDAGGRLLEWWSSGWAEVSQLGLAVVSCKKVRAFIVRVTWSPYLNPLSSLLLTIPLHLTIPSVVFVARCAPAGKGCRPCPPYLCQVGRMTADPFMPASGRLPRVGSTTLAGQLSEGARTWRPGQYLSYQFVKLK